MKQSTKDIEDLLRQEMEWLASRYPLTAFTEVCLHLYPANGLLGSDPSEGAAVDAFVTEVISGEELTYGIFIIGVDGFEIDAMVQLVMDTWGVEHSTFLLWLLYHEYGHLVHLHETLTSEGVEGLLEEKAKMEKDLVSLGEKRSELSPDQFNRCYRDLPFERKADEFAAQIYSVRIKSAWQ